MEAHTQGGRDPDKRHIVGWAGTDTDSLESESNGGEHSRKVCAH